MTKHQIQTSRQTQWVSLGGWEWQKTEEQHGRAAHATWLQKNPCNPLL